MKCFALGCLWGYFQVELTIRFSVVDGDHGGYPRVFLGEPVPWKISFR
jgi:hypothetical protein